MTESSRLRISAADGVAQITLQGGRNLQYDVQSTADLVSWSRLSTLTITNFDGTAQVTDTNAPAPGPDHRLYRAVLR